MKVKCVLFCFFYFRNVFPPNIIEATIAQVSINNWLRKKKWFMMFNNTKKNVDKDITMLYSIESSSNFIFMTVREVSQITSIAMWMAKYMMQLSTTRANARNTNAINKRKNEIPRVLFKQISKTQFRIFQLIHRPNAFEGLKKWTAKFSQFDTSLS